METLGAIPYDSKVITLCALSIGPICIDLIVYKATVELAIFMEVLTKLPSKTEKVVAEVASVMLLW